MGNKTSNPIKVYNEYEMNIIHKKDFNSFYTRSQKQIQKNKKQLFDKIITNYRKGCRNIVIHDYDIRLTNTEIKDVCLQINTKYGNIVNYLPRHFGPNKYKNYNIFILQEFISTENSV